MLNLEESLHQINRWGYCRIRLSDVYLDVYATLGYVYASESTGSRMDLNTTAFRIVKTLSEDDPVAAAKRAAKSRAGKAGGVARAKALTDSERKQIALTGTQARWPQKSQ
jgi:hypothetical protein